MTRSRFFIAVKSFWFPVTLIILFLQRWIFWPKMLIIYAPSLKSRKLCGVFRCRIFVEIFNLRWKRYNCAYRDNFGYFRLEIPRNCRKSQYFFQFWGISSLKCPKFSRYAHFFRVYTAYFCPILEKRLI